MSTRTSVPRILVTILAVAVIAVIAVVVGLSKSGGQSTFMQTGFPLICAVVATIILVAGVRWAKRAR
jgi:high-affinity Fe2+/Pb2+ permease